VCWWHLAAKTGNYRNKLELEKSVGAIFVVEQLKMSLCYDFFHDTDILVENNLFCGFYASSR